MSFLISFHLLRDLGKGQTVSVGTIIQTDCQSPPFTINLMLTLLMVVGAIDGGRERAGLILYVPFQAEHIDRLKSLDVHLP